MNRKNEEESKELSAEEALLKAKSDALRLVSFRPRSIEELRGKLKLKKYDAGTIDSVIEIFKKQGLLDDEKFARLFANSQVNVRPSGKKQLERTLKQKGLDKELVAKTIGELEGYDEKEAAANLVRRRFELTKDLPREKRKARLFGFLQRRGFGTEVIYSVMNDLFKGEIDENG